MKISWRGLSKLAIGLSISSFPFLAFGVGVQPTMQSSIPAPTYIPNVNYGNNSPRIQTSSFLDFGGFDFGGLNFGSFDPGSLGIDLGSFGDFNFKDFDLGSLNLGDLNLGDLTSNVQAISNNLNALNSLALNASSSLQSMQDSLVSQVSFNVETAFGSIPYKDLVGLTRNPQLFGKYLEGQLAQSQSIFNQDGVNKLFSALNNDAFKGSDLKRLLGSSIGGYNAYTGFKKSIDTLLNNPTGIFSGNSQRPGSFDTAFERQISQKTMGDLKGNILEHMQGLFDDDKKNPQLGETQAAVSDPIRGMDPNRVSNSPSEVQRAIIGILNKQPAKLGGGSNLTCAGPNSQISNAATANSVSGGNPANNALTADASAIFAGPLPQYRPSTSDGSVKILWRMFGDPGKMGIVRVDSGETSPNESKMSRMFMVFNTAVSAIAALWLTFTMGSAMLQGGHDGEFLGKRYHSFWLPLRTTLGSVLILPIPLIGYSLAQVIVMIAATTGIGIANAVAGFASELIVDAAPEPAPFVQPILVNSFEANAVTDAACAARLNLSMLKNRGGYSTESNETSSVSVDNAPSANIDFGVSFNSNDGVIANFGARPINTVPNFQDYGYQENSCGSINYVTASQALAANKDLATQFDLQSESNKRVVHDALVDLGSANSEAFMQYANAIMNISNAYYLYANAPDGSLADRARRGLTHITLEDVQNGSYKPPETYADFFGTDWSRVWIDEGAYHLLTGLSGGFYNLWVLSDAEKAKTQIACGAKTSYQEVAKSYGWIGVGFTSVSSLYNNFNVRKQSEKKEVKTEMPSDYVIKKLGLDTSSAPPTGEKTNWQVAKDVGKMVLAGAVKVASASADFVVDAADKVSSAMDFIKGGGIDRLKAMAKDPRLLFTEVLDFKSSGLDFKKGFTSLPQVANTGIAVIGLLEDAFKALLNVLGTIGVVQIGLMLTAAGPTIAQGVSGYVNLVIGMVGFFLTVFAVPVGYLGVKLALLIPMIPVVKWVGAILTWIVIVIEAMLASPWWAMAHLEGEGEGLGRNTGHGYIFFLNLLFRPAILVIIFALTTTVLSVVMGLLNSNLGALLEAAMSTDSFGFVGKLIFVIGGLALMVTLFETTLSQVYSILDEGPDKVFTWIGGNFGSNVGRGMEGGVSGAGAGAQQAMNSAAQGASGILSGAGGAVSKGAGMAQSRIDKEAALNAKSGISDLQSAASLDERIAGGEFDGDAGALKDAKDSSADLKASGNAKLGKALNTNRMSMGGQQSHESRNSIQQGLEGSLSQMERYNSSGKFDSVSGAIRQHLGQSSPQGPKPSGSGSSGGAGMEGSSEAQSSGGGSSTGSGGSNQGGGGDAPSVDPKPGTEA